MHTIIITLLLFTFFLEIQALMMSGRVSQAVAMVNRLHPGLFEANQELLFRVLCHQFIETIAGYDSLPSRGGVSNEVNGEIEDENMETETKGKYMYKSCDLLKYAPYMYFFKCLNMKTNR